MSDTTFALMMLLAFGCGVAFTLGAMVAGAVLGEVAYHIAAKFTRLAPEKK